MVEHFERQAAENNFYFFLNQTFCFQFGLNVLNQLFFTSIWVVTLSLFAARTESSVINLSLCLRISTQKQQRNKYTICAFECQPRLNSRSLVSRRLYESITHWLRLTHCLLLLFLFHASNRLYILYCVT